MKKHIDWKRVGWTILTFPVSISYFLTLLIIDNKYVVDFFYHNGSEDKQ